jgi:outer membrane biosynthesis protein TonB
MSRDSIHISMSEPLRRAQVRQRLQALADATGLPVALVAARALTLGIGPIEDDLRLMFPAPAALTPPTVTSASDIAPTAAPPSNLASDDAPPQTTASAKEPPQTTATTDAPPSAPAQTVDPQRAPAPSSAEPSPPPAVAVEPEPAPQRAEPPALVTAKAAALALGHGTASAFSQHRQRHPELKRCARQIGDAQLWDLAKLRAEYAGKGWKLKRVPRAAARQR